MADNNSIMALASKLRIPAPELTKDGRVLPPCTVKSFLVPHPDWEIKQKEKELSDLLPKSLPAVPGVSGNQSNAHLHLDFNTFGPKVLLSESQVCLQTATNVQKALRTALIHPAVEQSLLPAPTSDHHPGLMMVEDLRCLTKSNREVFTKNGVEFFYPAMPEHILGGPSKFQQYLLSCLVFGWYPTHFRQKKLSQATYDDLTTLANRISEHDDKSSKFQAPKTMTLCPFKDCPYICSSQYSAMKHAMTEHYHTWVVCGVCLCYSTLSLMTNVASVRGLLSLREHILLCRSSSGSPSEVAPPKEVPLGKSSLTSCSGSVGTPEDDANADGGSADGT